MTTPETLSSAPKLQDILPVEIDLDTPQAETPNHDKLSSLVESREFRNKRLAATKQLELLVQAKQGDQAALEELWLNTQNIARWAAKKHADGLPTDDDIQTCLAVVPAAVQRYNASKGASFTTYLATRMSCALIDGDRARARADGLTRNNYEKLRDALKSDDANIALHELTQPRKTTYGRLTAGFAMAPYLVNDSVIQSSPASLEELSSKVNDPEDPRVTVEPTANLDVAEEALKNIEIQYLYAAIKELPERLQLVLVYYYGLCGTRPMVSREIAEHLGISETRVSQLRKVAVNALSAMHSSDEP